MYQDKDIIAVHGENYVRESAIQAPVESSSLCESWVGKFVICRTRNEGINAGTVVAADETGVILKDCRRIWYHKPKDKNMSWYEGVAISGLSDDSKVSVTSSSKMFCEDYSLTECTEVGKTSIMGKAPNEQG